MVIVQLDGGLGNQMFQYACGRAVAERLGTVLKLDLSVYEFYPLRRYGLSCFHIIEHIATLGEATVVRGLNKLDRLGLRVSRRLGSQLAATCLDLAGTYVGEKTAFTYDPVVSAHSGNIYLKGYWQTERYFAGIRDILLREFAVKYSPTESVLRYADKIKSTDSISIHIRRGDYVSNPVTNMRHGTCSIDYYQRAVQLIADRVENPHFFLFSDDLLWVRDHLKLDFPMTLVGHPDANSDYDDLRLMQACHHHIIANSSFSWWGAWLCTDKDKVVIAPSQWFADPSLSTPDLLPQDWIGL